MSKLERAKRAWRRQRDQFQPTIQRQRGMLGNGSGLVRVPNRPDLVYVRLNADSRTVWKVRNDAVSDINNQPVIIEKEPDGANWRVVETYRHTIAHSGSGWQGDLTSPTHHTSHEWPDFDPGPDAVNVFHRAHVPLRTEPQTSYDLTVVVQPLRYSYEGVVKNFLGDTLDLSSYVPVSGVRRVLTYLDVRDNQVYAIAGNPVTYKVTADPPPPRVPWYAKPSTLVTLRQSQNIITESDMEPMTLIFDEGGIVHNLQAGRAPTVNDDALLGFSEGSIWIYSNTVYVLTNPAIGAAVWLQVGGNNWPGVDEIKLNGVTYTTVAAALSAASDGDQLIFGPGSFSCEGQTISGKDVDFLGSGRDVTNLTAASNDDAVIIDGQTCVFENLSLSNIQAIGPTRCLKLTNGAKLTISNAAILTTVTTSGVNYAVFLENSGNGGNITLIDCDIQALETTLGTSEGIHAEDNSQNVIKILGGSVQGADLGIRVTNGTITYIGPTVDGGVTLGGSAVEQGYYYNLSGDMLVLPAQDSIQMQELSGTPSTPPTGHWKLYFKSGGLHILDDAGTETGPIT